MKQCTGNFKSQLKKHLEEGQPMNGVIDDIEFTSLDTLLDSREMSSREHTVQQRIVPPSHSRQTSERDLCWTYAFRGGSV